MKNFENFLRNSQNSSWASPLRGKFDLFAVESRVEIRIYIPPDNKNYSDTR